MIVRSYVQERRNISSFNLSYRLRLLLIVCGNIASNPGPGSDRGFGSSIIIFVVVMTILTSWLWLDRIMMFWFVPIKKVSGRRHLSDLLYVSLALIAPNRGLPSAHLVPRVWLFMLGNDSAPTGRASWSVLAKTLVCFVFAVE